MIVYLLYFLHISTVFSTFIPHKKYEYDYIIVGSGSAGSVVAYRLSEDPTIKVLLLEAGGRPSVIAEFPLISEQQRVSPVSWNYTTVPQRHSGFGLNDRITIVPRGKVLGGSSTINGNLYTRGNKYDFNKWAAHGAVGWDYEGVLPYFIKHEDNGNLTIVANGYHGVGGEQPVNHPPFHSPITGAYLKAVQDLGYMIEDFNGKNETVFMPPQGTVKEGRSWSGLKSFIDPIRGRRNIRILTHSYVTKILINRNKRAYGVTFERNHTVYKAIAKEEVIICAGAINSPQLLMLSGIGPKEHLKELHIPVLSDLPVGENMQDHPTSFMQIFLTNTYTYREGRLTKDDYTQFLKFGIGPLTSLAALEIVGFIRSDDSLEAPDLEILWRTVNAGQSEEIYKSFFNARRELWKAVEPYAQKDVIHCLPYVLNPKSRGKVWLASADPHDYPLIDPNFYSHPDDIKVMVQGMKFCLKMAAQEPMKQKGVRPIPLQIPGCEPYEVFSDDYLACAAKVALVSLDHYAGTCKMGDPSDPSTVVDPLLRVKGIHSLRVVDASIMPFITSGHTHAPTAMIGDKGSDMILRDLAHRRKKPHASSYQFLDW